MFAAAARARAGGLGRGSAPDLVVFRALGEVRSVGASGVRLPRSSGLRGLRSVKPADPDQARRLNTLLDRIELNVLSLPISTLVCGMRSRDELKQDLGVARDFKPMSESELAEVMIHLAFYAGWPRAISAILVAKEVFKE